MKKSFWGIVGLGFVTVGCTASAVVSAKAPDDAGDCTQAGSSACENALSALCTRWVQCCDGAGAPSCQSWATNMGQCMAYWTEQGYDCSSSTYADFDVCADTTATCENDVPLMACADLYDGTANWPASCTSFWQQFPAPAATGSTGAGSTGSSSPSSGDAEDAGDDACAQSGSSACDDVLNALCTRWVECCDADDAPECQSWATSVTQCQDYWVGAGYDCSSSTYSDWNVCASTTTACEDDVALMACSDAYQGTANWPASCKTFWQQFP